MRHSLVLGLFLTFGFCLAGCGSAETGVTAETPMPKGRLPAPIAEKNMKKAGGKDMPKRDTPPDK